MSDYTLEFKIREKLNSLIGEDQSLSIEKIAMSPSAALEELSTILKKLPIEIIEEEINTARNEISKVFFEE